MKPLVIFFLIVNLILLIAEISTQKPKKTFCSGKPCNTILIVVDTLGAKHLGLYGYPRQTSPFIDAFFSENSLIFKNAISNAAWTNPSFASLFTSQYASDIPIVTWKDKIPSDMPNFADILRKSNVNLRLIRTGPPFDKDLSPAYESLFQENEKTSVEENLSFFSASEWIKNQKTSSGPFFLFIHNWTVHDPYATPTKYTKLFTEGQAASAIYHEEIKDEIYNLQKGNISLQNLERFKLAYDQQIRYFDDQLKDFISSLDPDIINNSIIILTADHGEAFGEHNSLTHNIKPYQEVIHIPLLIHLPGKKTKIVEENVSLLELAPTILDIYGITPPKEFRGESLWNLKKNQQRKNRVIKSEFFGSITSISDANVIETKDIIKNAIEARILENWKVIIDKSTQQTELYNLKDDPEEKSNLIGRTNEIKAEERKFVDLLLND